MRPREADVWLSHVYTVTLCRRCFVIELENQMLMRVNGTERCTVRVLTGNCRWEPIGNSLNQNAAVGIEAMVHTVGSSPADPVCGRAWGSLRVSGRAACMTMGLVLVDGVTSCMGEVRMEMLVLHLPAPALPWGCACHSSCRVAVPGCRTALRECSTFQSHLPSGRSGTVTACGTKPGQPTSVEASVLSGRSLCAICK